MNSEVRDQSKPDKRSTFNRLQLLFGLILLPVFVFLGLWQLDRADVKEQLLQDIDSQPRQLSSAADSQRLLMGRALQPVLSQFTQIDPRYFLLDNRTREGRVGYEVIAPVQIGQSWMLANFGWTPGSSDRRILPGLEFEADLPIEIEGVLALPENLLQLSKSSPEGGQWPQRVQYIDPLLFSNLLNLPVEPVLLKVYSRVVDEVQPHVPALNSMPPQRHIGYAVQWFGLAIALVIWLAVSMRISRRES